MTSTSPLKARGWEMGLEKLPSTAFSDSEAVIITVFGPFPYEATPDRHFRMLRNALKKFSFDLSGTHSIPIHDVDISIFEVFFRWLYVQNHTGVDGETLEKENIEDIVRLYIFAHEIQVPALQYAVINEFRSRFGPDKQTQFPGRDIINSAFRRLPDDSPMCLELIEMYYLHELEIEGDYIGKDFELSWRLGLLNRYVGSPRPRYQVQENPLGEFPLSRKRRRIDTVDGE